MARVIGNSLRIFGLVMIFVGSYYVATLRAEPWCDNGQNCYMNVSTSQPYCQSYNGGGKYVQCNPIQNSIYCWVKVCGREEEPEYGGEEVVNEGECTECSR